MIEPAGVAVKGRLGAAPAYRGRFAPSPTGPLHFGSLVAAVGSRLDALAHGGEWLLRMEDVDAPRNVPGAAEGILTTLEAYGFEWEGSVLRQSERLDAYQAALDKLIRNRSASRPGATLIDPVSMRVSKRHAGQESRGQAYPCACSRREIADSASHAAIDGGLAYPGTCRGGLPPGRPPRAWRLRVDNDEVAFLDRLQGRISQHLETDVGDFVLLRADGQFAYQLAVVVDDAFQGITHVVRGADLLASTPRQIWLQRCLGVPTPTYVHLPVATNGAGEKLSKQTLAPALDPDHPGPALIQALQFLGQQPPVELARAAPAEIWQWAQEHWNFEAVPRREKIPLPGEGA